MRENRGVSADRIGDYLRPGKRTHRHRRAAYSSGSEHRGVAVIEDEDEIGAREQGIVRIGRAMSIERNASAGRDLPRNLG